MEYDVFISYSRKDISEVLAIKQAIERKVKGIRIWFDINGIESGDEFEDKIIKAINNSKYVLFALSPNSIGSQWTKDEVMYAKNTGKKVVPILLHGAKLEGWFLFKFGRIDCIDSTKSLQMDKLTKNLSLWCELENSIDIDSQEEKTDNNVAAAKYVHHYPTTINETPEVSATNEQTIIDKETSPQQCHLDNKVSDETCGEDAANEPITERNVPYTPQKKFGKHHYYIAAGVCAVIGYLCVGLFDNVSFGEEDSNEITTEALIDTTATIDYDTQSVEDTSAIDEDVVNKELETQMQSFISLSEKCCDKVEPRSGDKAMIQELLDAKYYYYDKAQSIYRQLYGNDIERNTRIDALVKREYEYWINKGNSVGKSKRNYAMKKAYYENAYKLVNSERIKSYIDWLDSKLKK